MGERTDVDTTSFRRAIWNYIHCMFGIRHDDYDYNEVNELLEVNLKAYIKLVTCFPENVARKDYASFMTEFLESEKVACNEFRRSVAIPFHRGLQGLTAFEIIKMGSFLLLNYFVCLFSCLYVFVLGACKHYGTGGTAAG